MADVKSALAFPIPLEGGYQITLKHEHNTFTLTASLDGRIVGENVTEFTGTPQPGIAERELRACVSWLRDQCDADLAKQARRTAAGEK